MERREQLNKGTRKKIKIGIKVIQDYYNRTFH